MCRISWQAQDFCEPPCADFVAGAALCEPPCADFVAGTALCAPPCADFVAGAIQNALWRDSERTKCCIFSMEPMAPKLASQGLRNDGCETVSGHARIMLGHARNRPSIGIRKVFTCFLNCRFRGRVQHFVNLHVQISWQVQHFVNLHVQISFQAQDFANLHVQMSWQVQHFVNLHVQIFVAGCGRHSTLCTSMCRFRGRRRRESERTKCCIFQWTRWLRRVRDGLGSCSDHASGMVGIVVHWD